MFELILSRDLQDIVHSSTSINQIRNFPYRVRLVNYSNSYGYHELKESSTILIGDYFKELNLPPDFGTQQLYNSIDDYERKGIILFGNQLLGMRITDPEIIHALLLTIGNNTVDDGNEFKGIIDKAQQFTAALKFLCDVEIVKSALPVEVSNIYFTVSKGSLDDELLNSKAELLDRFIAPNGQDFNIYRLWKSDL